MYKFSEKIKIAKQNKTCSIITKKNLIMFKLLKDHDLPEPHFIIFPDDPIEPIVTILENLGLGSDETIHLENGKNVHTIDGFTLVIYYEI